MNVAWPQKVLRTVTQCHSREKRSFALVFLNIYRLSLLWKHCTNTILTVNRFFKVPSCTGNPCNATACVPNPCKNGAQCMDHISGFSCVCKPGLTGQLCESHYNHCDSTPCQNGGTCTNGVDTFTCTCARGFTGDICEKRSRDCADPPSIANGRVRSTKSYGLYTCNSGYKTIGLRFIRCVNGRWIGKPPTCQSGEPVKIITMHILWSVKLLK